MANQSDVTYKYREMLARKPDLKPRLWCHICTRNLRHEVKLRDRVVAEPFTCICGREYPVGSKESGYTLFPPYERGKGWIGHADTDCEEPQT